MSQKHELPPDSAPEPGPATKKTKTSDGIDLALAASILYECWTEGWKILGNDNDNAHPPVHGSAQQMTIEPSSDIRVPVDDDQDRIYVTGLIERCAFSSLIENNMFDVFWAWTPSEKVEKGWLFCYVGYIATSQERKARKPLVDTACVYKNAISIALHNNQQRDGGDMRHRLWGAGMCMCPDTHRFFTVTGEVYVTVVVRDSVAKKLNDDRPGSFVPFHAN